MAKSLYPPFSPEAFQDELARRLPHGFHLEPSVDRDSHVGPDVWVLVGGEPEAERLTRFPRAYTQENLNSIVFVANSRAARGRRFTPEQFQAEFVARVPHGYRIEHRTDGGSHTGQNIWVLNDGARRYGPRGICRLPHAYFEDVLDRLVYHANNHAGNVARSKARDAATRMTAN